MLQHGFVPSDAKSRGVIRDDVTVLRGGSVQPQDIPGITDMVGMELGKIRPVPGRDEMRNPHLPAHDAGTLARWLSIPDWEGEPVLSFNPGTHP